jgi:hypothetical protein
VKFWFNPLTAKFEVKEQVVANSNDVVVVRNCDASVAIGDFVSESLTVANKVETLTNNTSIAPCIGVVEAKPTATTCVVKQIGLQPGFGGLIQGKHIFLSTAGTATNTPPATGYLQILGVATSTTEILINVQILRIKRAS